jgi:hypothetical protein
MHELLENVRQRLGREGDSRPFVSAGVDWRRIAFHRC